VLCCSTQLFVLRAGSYDVRLRVGCTLAVLHETLPPFRPPSKERGAQATSLVGATPTKLQGDPHYANVPWYAITFPSRPTRTEPRTQGKISYL
jgi:hypothetical protein